MMFKPILRGSTLSLLLIALLAIQPSVVAISQVGIDLPTSCTFVVQNSSMLCMVSPVGISFRSNDTSELIYKQVPVSGVNPLGWGIVSVDVSKDGRFVFVATVQADGVYRYDVRDDAWRVVTPPEAGRDITAVHLDENGNVFIGTGGTAGSDHTSTRGLFKSTDFGTSWTNVEFRDSSLKSVPGIRQIESMADGRLIVVAIRKLGSSEPGVYRQAEAGLWQWLGDETGSVIVAGTGLYSASANSAISYYDLTEGIPSKKLISVTGDILSDWRGDTITVFQNSFSSEFYSKLYFVVHGEVKRSVSVRDCRAMNDRYRFCSYSDKADEERMVLSGGGSNRSLNPDGTTKSEIAFQLDLPSVGGMVDAGTWTLVYVSGHGWYRVDKMGVCTLDGSLDSIASSSSGTRFATQSDILVVNQRSISRISLTNGERVVVVEQDTSFTAATILANGQLLCATRESGIILFDPATSQWRSFDTIGLPHTSDFYGQSRMALCRSLFVVDGILYSWFDYDGPKMALQAGLYSYANNEWKLREVEGLTSTPTLSSFAYNNGVVSLTVDEVVDSYDEPSNVVVVRDDSSIGISTVVKSIESSLPSITQAVTNSGATFWVTGHGVVWKASMGSGEPVKFKEGLNASVGILNGNLLVSTRDSGLLLYDQPTTISNEYGSTSASSALTYPSPVRAGDLLYIRLPRMDGSLQAVATYDVCGTLVRSAVRSVSIDEDYLVVSLDTGELLGAIYARFVYESGARQNAMFIVQPK